MLKVDVIDDGADGWPAKAVVDEERRAVSALNFVAERAVLDIRMDMHRRFTLRNSWLPKGIRFDRANTETLTARVYSVDPYLFKQEEGESYSPDGHVAIPSAARPTQNSLIPKSMMPKALRGNPKVFKFDFSRNSGYKPYPLVGLFQRTGGGRFFKVLYLLKDRKTTRARWDFEHQVDEAVGEYFTSAMATTGKI